MHIIASITHPPNLTGRQSISTTRSYQRSISDQYPSNQSEYQSTSQYQQHSINHHISNGNHGHYQNVGNGFYGPTTTGTGHQGSLYSYPKQRLYPAMPGREFVCVEGYTPRTEGDLHLRKGDFVEGALHLIN